MGNDANARGTSIQSYAILGDETLRGEVELAGLAPLSPSHKDRIWKSD